MEDVQKAEVQSRKAEPSLSPTFTAAGSPDRDARNIPYSFGTRKERRKISAQIGKMAAIAKRKKREQSNGKS